MLDWDIGECMVSLININNGIKGITCGYQNFKTNPILLFGGYFEVRESLYTHIILWVHSILNHIDTRAILPRYEGSRMVYRLKWY